MTLFNVYSILIITESNIYFLFNGNVKINELRLNSLNLGNNYLHCVLCSINYTSHRYGQLATAVSSNKLVQDIHGRLNKFIQDKV